MRVFCLIRTRSLRFLVWPLSLAALMLAAPSAPAHPLGNFSVNHFTRLELSADHVRVYFVVDMAEISTYQELQAVDADGDGKSSQAELDAYATRMVAEYGNRLLLTLDGSRVFLIPNSSQINLPAGAGNLPTLRFECHYEAALPAGSNSEERRLRFEDLNHPGRIGWHEIVVLPRMNVQAFNSTVFGGSSLSDELRNYPTEMLAAPLSERTAELSFTAGPPPAKARLLIARDARMLVEPSRDRLAELIAVPNLTLGIAFIGLLIAAALGGVHALSPGHGKTVVAAYLIGSRGTAKHAAFLGVTVTITHTAGVFALGLVTLFAAQYVVPERIYPILSFLSGAIIVLIGIGLFAKRLRAALGLSEHGHQHSQAHPHSHEERANDSAFSHAQHHDGIASLKHSHGGIEHSHLPPGADGSAVTWRSLLGLGVSGGLLPCPSALVVLLIAISNHRVGYGMLMVLAFSLGLASVLTGIGLLFVYARRLVERPLAASARLVRVLPAISAVVITCAGFIIAYQALVQAGIDVSSVLLTFLTEAKGIFSSDGHAFSSMSALATLSLGLVFGLKHATEVDHVIAVTTIVSEQRKLWRAALVGVLWGTGHTASLVVIGVIVLVLHVAIPDSVSDWLEFCVALMIILMGATAFYTAFRQRRSIHVHQHQHDGYTHAHLHFHDEETPHEDVPHTHSHSVRHVGLKPMLVGVMHGLAGSATLTLLVLSQITSAFIGILYLLVFGLGSIVGMLLMSGLVGLPFVFSARKLGNAHYALQTAAGALSVCFGLWYAYQTGVASGLLAAII